MYPYSDKNIDARTTHTLPNEYHMDHLHQTQPEPYYETLPRDYDKPAQPADYEEFQSSLAVSTTSNMPLLTQSLQNHEFRQTAANPYTPGHTNDLYNVIQEEGSVANATDGQTTAEDCEENHLYFTLEPREP